jgi:hypothetical protein
LYADFGNVHEKSFKSWWQEGDRGATLFAEEPTGRVQLIRESFQMAQKRNSLIIELPLSLPKRFLLKEVRTILRREHPGTRGVQIHRNSTARYQFTGHVDIESFDKALRIYDYKQDHPKMRLWELAQNTKVTSQDSRMKDEDWMTSDRKLAKKMVLANTASRLLKRAKRMIAAAGEGRFPQ